MNIGFDGKRATQNYTGLGNYSRYVLNIMREFHPSHKYSVYTIRQPSPELRLPSVSYHFPPNSFLKSYWRSFGIASDLKREGIELYHGLSNEIPFTLKRAGIPSIVTIHDLIFLRYPRYYPLADRKIYEIKSRYAALNASKVIAISQQTKRDLIRFFGLSEESIEVIYQNCDPVFRRPINPDEKSRIRHRYGLPEEYLLSVGTIEDRKNLLLVVKALNECPDRHLVVIGRETSYAQQVKDYIRNNGLENRVSFLKDVPHTDLPGIYQLASIFIYPSRFEGFGIPILEALYSGVPVIAAKGSCLEEAGGPGSIYVNPADSKELAREINGLLCNKERRQNMIEGGYEHLRNFEDKKIADQLIELYQKTIKECSETK